MNFDKLLATAVLVAAGCTGWAQTTGDNPDQQRQLIQLEEKWLSSSYDPDALQTILADDFIHVLPGGFVTKKEQIEYLRRHPMLVHGTRQFQDLNVRIFGSTAIVIGIVAINGGDGTVRNNAFTDVFVLRGGRWQAVNAQELPLGESSTPKGNVVATVPANLRADVAAGNQAWIDGMKVSNIAHAVSAFAPDAIFCTSAGDCFKGPTAIASLYKDLITKFGQATNASVSTQSLIPDRDLAYESGYSEVDFPAGFVHRGRFSTVWKMQADGHWKIIRNMSLLQSKGGE